MYIELETKNQYLLYETQLYPKNNLLHLNWCKIANALNEADYSP